MMVKNCDIVRGLLRSEPWERERQYEKTRARGHDMIVFALDSARAENGEDEEAEEAQEECGGGDADAKPAAAKMNISEVRIKAVVERAFCLLESFVHTSGLCPAFCFVSAFHSACCVLERLRVLRTRASCMSSGPHCPDGVLPA